MVMSERSSSRKVLAPNREVDGAWLTKSRALPGAEEFIFVVDWGVDCGFLWCLAAQSSLVGGQ